MMHDQELAVADEVFFSGNAYDEHGPYDIDYTSLPAIPSSSSSRSTLPYDDPYADSYVAPEVVEAPSEPTFSRDRSFDRDRPTRGRGRGNRSRSYGDRGSGRGGGRGRGQRHPRQHQEARPSPKAFLPSTQTTEQVGYPGHHRQQEYSPLYPDQQMRGPIPMHHSYSTSSGYQHQPQYTESLGFLLDIQPHINPRFASALGFSVHPTFAGHVRNPPSQEQAYTSPSNWTDEWTIPTLDPGGFGPNTRDR